MELNINQQSSFSCVKRYKTIGMKRNEWSRPDQTGILICGVQTLSEGL